MKRSIELILGSPGCGKTHTLLDIIDREFSQGVMPNEMAFITFTRAAKSEAVSRMLGTFGYGAGALPYFRTLHSMCARLLDHPREFYLKEKQLNEFGDMYGYEFNRGSQKSVKEGSLEISTETESDRLMATYQWARSKLIEGDHNKVVKETPFPVGLQNYIEFVKRYSEYREKYRYIDFTDILEKALHRGLAPPVKVLIVDEAQDLSPLQIMLIETWFWNNKIERMYVAGDDDQALFSFQGASPDWLQMLTQYPECTTRILEQSWRVPRAVHERAHRIIHRNKNRIDKEYRPADREGETYDDDLYSAIAAIEGSAFILARCAFSLEAAAKELFLRKVPYVNERGKGPNPLGKEGIRVALEALSDMAGGVPVQARKMHKLLELVPSRLQHEGEKILPHGVKAKVAEAKKEGEQLSVFTWRNELKLGQLSEVAEKIGRPNVMQRLEPMEIEFLNAVVDADTGKLPDAEVTLTTIHGSKGREADTVIIIPDHTRSVERHRTESVAGYESENRVAYVGATRAKEKLIVCEPDRWLYQEY
jgi:superfamily I DNA/RNA helicase